MSPEYEVECNLKHYSSDVTNVLCDLEITLRELHSGMAAIVSWDADILWNGTETEFRGSILFNKMLEDAKGELVDMLRVAKELDVVNLQDLEGVK